MKRPEKRKIFLGRKNSEEKKILLEGKKGGGVARTASFVARGGWRSWN
jgi:hypothetical protein